MEDPESVWIHDDGYGSPAVGGIVSGFIMIVVGIVQLIIYAIKRAK